MSPANRSVLGRRQRHRGKHNGWTLSQVGKYSGLATSTLSKVENGQTSLTCDNLQMVANGFRVTIAELFATSGPAAVKGRRAVTRMGDEKTQDTANHEYKYHSVDLKGAHIAPIVVKVKERSIEDFGPLLRHAGEEFIYVIAGAIEVHIEFYEPTRLEAGESIYRHSTMGHGYVSVGRGDATVPGVCSGAVARVWTDLAPQ